MSAIWTLFGILYRVKHTAFHVDEADFPGFSCRFCCCLRVAESSSVCVVVPLRDQLTASNNMLRERPRIRSIGRPNCICALSPPIESYLFELIALDDSSGPLLLLMLRALKPLRHLRPCSWWTLDEIPLTHTVTSQRRAKCI